MRVEHSFYIASQYTPNYNVKITSSQGGTRQQSGQTNYIYENTATFSSSSPGIDHTFSTSRSREAASSMSRAYLYNRVDNQSVEIIKTPDIDDIFVTGLTVENYKEQGAGGGETKGSTTYATKGEYPAHNAYTYETSFEWTDMKTGSSIRKEARGGGQYNFNYTYARQGQEDTTGNISSTYENATRSETVNLVKSLTSLSTRSANTFLKKPETITIEGAQSFWKTVLASAINGEDEIEFETTERFWTSVAASQVLHHFTTESFLNSFVTVTEVESKSSAIPNNQKVHIARHVFVKTFNNNNFQKMIGAFSSPIDNGTFNFANKFKSVYDDFDFKESYSETNLSYLNEVVMGDGSLTGEGTSTIFERGGFSYDNLVNTTTKIGDFVKRFQTLNKINVAGYTSSIKTLASRGYGSSTKSFQYNTTASVTDLIKIDNFNYSSTQLLRNITSSSVYNDVYVSGQTNHITGLPGSGSTQFANTYTTRFTSFTNEYGKGETRNGAAKVFQRRGAYLRNSDFYILFETPAKGFGGFLGEKTYLFSSSAEDSPVLLTTFKGSNSGITIFDTKCPIIRRYRKYTYSGEFLSSETTSTEISSYFVTLFTETAADISFEEDITITITTKSEFETTKSSVVQTKSTTFNDTAEGSYSYIPNHSIESSVKDDEINISYTEEYFDDNGVLQTTTNEEKVELIGSIANGPYFSSAQSVMTDPNLNPASIYYKGAIEITKINSNGESSLSSLSNNGLVYDSVALAKGDAVNVRQIPLVTFGNGGEHFFTFS